MSNWIGSKSWDIAWDAIEHLTGGGQGTVKKVRKKGTNDTAFLKVLSRQSDTERRARFFREATAYGTCSHEGIPRFIESNAHLHEDRDYKLYIVTEFVAGQTLTQYVKQRGVVTFDDASQIFNGLLDIAEYFHSEDWVHRDIKPDNIVLQNNDAQRPVLVDFGLGYKDGLTADFQTEHGQEIGNRFLRLPELSSGSPLKQDVRTDLTFLGGLLFYMLTGSPPSTLFDAEGKMPHQRESAPQVLRGSVGRGALLLLGFFDRCFSLKLSGRFPTASEMKNALQSIKAERDNVNSTTTNDDLQAILSGINTVASRRLAELKVIYDAALAVIVKIHREIAPQVSPTYTTFHTGYVNFSGGLRYDLGFQHFATQDRRFVLRFHIAIAGEEIVVSADDRVLYRTDANAPIFSEAFQEQVRKLFLSGLRQLVEQAQQAGH